MTSTSTSTPALAGAGRHARPAAEWIGPIATCWAGSYGVLALVWTLTGAGFPFGTNDRDERLSALRALPEETGAPLFGGILLGTAVVMAAMSGRHAVQLRGLPRLALLTAGWTVAAALVAVVPSVSLLALTGYAPMLILGAPFGWPDVDYGEVFNWPFANEAWCLVGGLLVARTTLAWQRRTGPDGAAAGGTRFCGREDAARWARWAVAVAVVVPLSYAVTRFAWVLNVPLGLTPAQLADLRAAGGHWVGGGLGAFAVVGAVLTVGLARPWGEVFPRWVPGLAGRRVPVGLAVVPAGYVSLIVTAAGVGMVASGTFWELLGSNFWLALPHLLWPAWGVALGAATYAYQRRRGGCARCAVHGGRAA